MVKRNAVVFLAVLLGIALSEVSWASGAAESATGQGAGPDVGVNLAGTPLVKEKATLTLATLEIEVPDKSFNDPGLAIIDELEKRTNVKINWEVNRSDYHTVMQTRLAAASNLPDIVLLPQNSDPVKYGSNGVILKLNDLITKYAPNTVKLFAKYPVARKTLTAPDGAIYGYPGQISPAANQFNCLGLGYRLDWLQKLNIPEPKTMDEWYQMLVAFRDRDPNGNGEKDEIPYVAAGPWAISIFQTAYGIANSNQGFRVNDAGKVEYGWISPKAKDLFTTMAKWWEEKLIDQGMLTAHGDKAMAYIIGNQTGAQNIWAQRLDQYTKEMQGKFPNARWVLAMPPQGPYGDGFYEEYSIVDTNRYAVTKSSKRPELAVRWLDYMFASEEGQMLFNFGIDGLTYTMANGKPTLNDFVLNNKTYPNPSMVMISLGASRVPQLVLPEALAQKSRALMPADSLSRLERASQFYKPQFPPVMSTSDEASQIARKMADIETYRNEMAQKFNTGREPISKFDDYVKTLKSLGIDEVIALKQAQYDRWMKN